MRRYSKWSRRAKVIGGVGALALLATSGAFAFVDGPDSTVSVTTDSGLAVHAASAVGDNGQALSPDSSIPIIIRVINPTSQDVSIASLAEGRSIQLGEVVEGVPSPEYCPAESIITAPVTPQGEDTVLTSREGSSVIGANGGEATFDSTATFDTDTFWDTTNPANDQNACLGVTHEVPVTVNLAP